MKAAVAWCARKGHRHAAPQALTSRCHRASVSRTEWKNATVRRLAKNATVDARAQLVLPSRQNCTSATFGMTLQIVLVGGISATAEIDLKVHCPLAEQRGLSSLCHAVIVFTATEASYGWVGALPAEVSRGDVACRASSLAPSAGCVLRSRMSPASSHPDCPQCESPLTRMAATVPNLELRVYSCLRCGLQFTAPFKPGSQHAASTMAAADTDKDQASTVRDESSEADSGAFLSRFTRLKQTP